MPITINGSGAVTGISAGGLPDGCVTTDDLANSAVTTAKLGNNEASGLCKAWVNFNGTSTVAIRASYNVSSITDNGVGDYTVNFTTALADANYAFNGTAGGTASAGVIRTYEEVTARTTSAIRLAVFASTTGSFADMAHVNAAIFR